MDVIITTGLSPVKKEFIFQLWNKEYPVQLGFKTIADLDNYLDTLNDLNFFFLQNKNSVEGWAMTFGRDGEKWFAITIDSKAQGKGKGSFLLNNLKQHSDILNGWVIDHENDITPGGEKYKSPLQFYIKNGFIIHAGIRLEIPVLSAVKISWYSG